MLSTIAIEYEMKSGLFLTLRMSAERSLVDGCAASAAEIKAGRQVAEIGERSESTE